MRAGRTKTTSFSLDEETLANLKALAKRRHNGNVSALLAEFAAQESQLVAAERFLKKYKVPPLTAEAAAAIDKQWEDALATRPTNKKKKSRKAA